MTTAPSENNRPTRPARWSTAVKIVVIGGLVVLGLWFAPWWKEPGVRTMATESAAAAVAVLLVLWLIFFAQLPKPARVALALLLLSPVAFLRVTCTGDLVAEVTVRRWVLKSLGLRNELAKDSLQVEPVQLAPIGPHDFPQFLGPQRNGVLDDPGLARNWETHKPKQLWRQPIGTGFASFAAVGDYAFTLEQRDDAEMVTCYEVATGKLRWLHDLGEPSFSTDMGGDGPRSTPAIADGRAYVLGVRGKLACLDAANGKQVWQQNILGDQGNGLPMWGKSCSPLLVDGLVIVSAGLPEGHSLVAYDAADGTPRWHAGNSPSSYSSPVLFTLGGVRQVVIVNADSVTSHDSASGRILWTFEWPGIDPKVSVPVQVGDDRVLIAAAYSLGAKLLEVKLDSNNTWSATPVWDSRVLKPKLTNIVARDGFAYCLDDGVTLNCVDLKDGKLRWRGGRGYYKHGQLLIVGDMLLAQTEQGDIVLVDANPAKYNELAHFTALSDKSWNIPCLLGSKLLVRNHEEAACYELPLADSK